MTTLAELRTKVSRDLRDPLNSVFLPVYVDDLINSGIEEISRVYPREVIDSIVPVVNQTAYPTECTTAFRAELWRDGKLYSTLTAQDSDIPGSGWDLWGGEFILTDGSIRAMLPARDSIRVWGYADRAQLLADAQVAELDVPGEWGVRHYSRATAFQLMQSDRALFKQWQAMSQATDLSPNQLTQMVGFFTSEWDRTRNYLRKLRRV
jgi:hypothetical protein